jgi:hypothetical protein
MPNSGGLLPAADLNERKFLSLLKLKLLFAEIFEFDTEKLRSSNKSYFYHFGHFNY